MEGPAVEWALFGLLVGLILLGVPVAFAMGLSVVFALSMTGATHLLPVIAQRMYSGSTSFILLAIPFFILAGLLMNAVGMTTRIFRFANHLIGRVTGGLGLVNVVASMIFSGMSGSAVADASGLGAIEIKAMNEAGYDRKFSAAVTAASSTIGPVVPPSIPFVIYGGLTGVSVGSLFLAGIVPGLLMGILLMVAVYIVSRRRRYPRNPTHPSVREFVSSFLDAAVALGSVVIIVGGITTGLFTPTEAAVVACLYALFLGFFVYRSLRFRELPAIVWEAAQSSMQVLLIIAVASAFAWTLTFLRIPEGIVSFVTDAGSHPLLVLLSINLLLLLLGCFMEGISIMLVSIPVLMPVLSQIGVDPLHFGVIITLNIMLGLITPPMGLSLYGVMSISNVSLPVMFRELLPYYLALLIALFTVTFWPGLVLLVPRLLS
jgi:C4-dicarboxylate transporter, DctM subunit